MDYDLLSFPTGVAVVFVILIMILMMMKRLAWDLPADMVARPAKAKKRVRFVDDDVFQ